MNAEQRAALRKLAEEATPGPWEIRWYECRADREDVKAKSAKRVGDLLWRVPKQIGPISAEENHWARLHLDVSEEDSSLIAAANPQAIRELLDYIGTLEKDAARYRWLRDTCMDDPKTRLAVMNGFIDYETVDYIYGEDMDAAIDAAMQGETE